MFVVVVVVVVIVVVVVVVVVVSVLLLVVVLRPHDSTILYLFAAGLSRCLSLSYTHSLFLFLFLFLCLFLCSPFVLFPPALTKVSTRTAACTTTALHPTSLRA